MSLASWAVARLQHRYVSLPGDVAVVLLVLGAPLAGVVRGNQHQSPETHVAGRHQRVVGYVHAHVLHNRKRPQSADGRRHGHFQGDLFINRPLGVHAGIFSVVHQGLGDFTGRRAGIRRHDLHAGLDSPPGDGLVAEHEEPGAGGIGSYRYFSYLVQDSPPDQSMNYSKRNCIYYFLREKETILY